MIRWWCGVSSIYLDPVYVDIVDWCDGFQRHNVLVHSFYYSTLLPGCDSLDSLVAPLGYAIH